jgi:hypothetical protein
VNRKYPVVSFADNWTVDVVFKVLCLLKLHS